MDREIRAGSAVGAGHFRLAQNRPNPFSRQTTIEYDLPHPAHVNLSIYDVGGRLVKAVIDRREPAGRYAAVWSGRDTTGKPIVPGVYFVRIQAGEFEATRKMVYLK